LPIVVLLSSLAFLWIRAHCRPPRSQLGPDRFRLRVRHARRQSPRLLPIGWIILNVIFLGGLFSLKIPVPGGNGLINRVPPVVPAPAPEHAVFAFNALSFTGTGIFVTAILSAFIMDYRFREAAAVWWKTLKCERFSLLTVAAMLAPQSIIVASTATKVRSSATSSSTAWPWLRSSACW
jgi:L-lactate permease